MSKIKVINKGYTITVVSWENDCDYYATKKITVETLEEAKMYYKLMQLCVSKNNQPTEVIKLGNSTQFSEKQKKVIIDFFKNYENYVKEYAELNNEEYNNYKDQYIFDLFYTITEDLLGSSEECICRVMESCTITYSPEDIYLEEITFKDE